MNLVYKGDTFIKETDDKHILRVGKKEYRFEKTKLDLDRCHKIIHYFAAPQSTEQMVGSEDKEDLKTMYLLLKLRSLVEVPDEFEMSPLNMYILRNYIDFENIIQQLQYASKSIELVDSPEALNNLKYAADSYIITSIFEENIISSIHSEDDFEIVVKELRNKKIRNKANHKIQKLLGKYVDILAIDQLSSHPKYENTFVFTTDLQMINYTPCSPGSTEAKQIMEGGTSSEEERVSKLLDYYQRHPSFFLTYYVEKDRQGNYFGNSYLRGYNTPKQEFHGPDYFSVLIQILEHTRRCWLCLV